MTKTTAAFALVLGATFLVGCGSNDSGNDSDRRAIVDKTVANAAESGIELDKACVAKVVDTLSAADVTAIANDDNENISDEGRNASLELIRCADEEQMTDLFIEGMRASDQDFDEACVREKLVDIDIADLVAAAQGSSPPSDIVDAMVECFPMPGG